MEEHRMVIGLPQGLLYYRYGALWQTFFNELGIETVLSGPTDRRIMDAGAALSIDEACLSLKIFLGHVAALAGRCDYVLVPRVSSFGRHRNMCTRFEALPDLTGNVFRGKGVKVLSYEVDVLSRKGEEAAFLSMAGGLGRSLREVHRAYRQAKKEDQARRKTAVRAEEQLYKSEGIKVLIAAHSYVVEDPYIGRAVTGYLKKSGVIPIRADVVDRDEALKWSQDISLTCKWEMSREIVGSVAMHEHKVDGIILLSAFPCGPDAMVNELISRRVRDVPMLNLVLDSQSGTAGVETRLESFVDIIRFKEGKL